MILLLCMLFLVLIAKEDSVLFNACPKSAKSAHSTVQGFEHNFQGLLHFIFNFLNAPKKMFCNKMVPLIEHFL